MRPDLSLGNYPSSETGNIERLLKMFSNNVDKVLDPMIETVMRVLQPYTTHEVVLGVSQSYYVRGGIVSILKDYNEERSTIQNISVPENPIQQFLHARNLGAIRI